MIEQFLSDLKPNDSILEFTSIKNWEVNVISRQEALNKKDSNIYFLWWVRNDFIHNSENKRVKDIDINKKNYFCIDIDLRKNFENSGWVITDDEIIEQGLLLWEELKTNKFFSEWRYIVFSWNWLHIYFVWEQVLVDIDYKDYALWVSRIFRKFDSEIWWEFICDHSCKNIARILRLPWSINQKNWQEVKIISFQNKYSSLVWNIPALATEEKKELELKNQEKKKEVEELLSKFSWDDNKIYDIILYQIPAWQIAQLILPEFPYNWKKNFKNKKWWFTWYYYVKETNSICNWGSRYFLFDWDEWSCWDNFQMIKRSKNLTNAETFKFFKELLNINKK